MRIRHIQRLAWGGNLLIACGLVLAGAQLVEASGHAPPAKLAWNTAGPPADAAPRWPGELEDFAHIAGTNISGRVREPQPPYTPPPIDVETAFRAKLTYLGGWDVPSRPELSTASVRFGGRAIAISPGVVLDGFQLVRFSVVQRPDSREQGATLDVGRLVFSHPRTGLPVEIEQTPRESPVISTPPGPFVPTHSAGVLPKVSATEAPASFAWFDDVRREWFVPAEEELWIAAFGKSKLLPALAATPDVDAAGVSHGLVIRGIPEAGTPLRTHGISIGNVVRSVNGVAIGSKEDVIRYLRGAGRQTGVFRVVVATNGADREITYNLVRGRR